MKHLSGAGKTTIARALVPVLEERGVKVERLDGDVVRESLTRDLGFSKEDRDMNIERVTFVAKLLSRNGVGVVASFISPYAQTREWVKSQVTNFIEVYVSSDQYFLVHRIPESVSFGRVRISNHDIFLCFSIKFPYAWALF